jgi:hypothetical protein
VVADQHALEWSTNMHWNGRPPWMVVAAHHAAEWSPTMQRSSLVDFISGEQTKETDENVGYLFLSGLQNCAIGRRNDEAIRK